MRSVLCNRDEKPKIQNLVSVTVHGGQQHAIYKIKYNTNKAFGILSKALRTRRLSLEKIIKKKKNFQHLTFILSTVYSKKCTRNTTPEFANKCLPYKRELNTKVTSDNERLVFVSGGFFFAPGDFVNDNRLICNKFDYDLYSVSRKTARTAENFSENERRARDDFTASSRFIQQYALE